MVGKIAAERSHFGTVERELLTVLICKSTSAKKSRTAGGQGDSLLLRIAAEEASAAKDDSRSHWSCMLAAASR